MRWVAALAIGIIAVAGIGGAVVLTDQGGHDDGGDDGGDGVTEPTTFTWNATVETDGRFQVIHFLYYMPPDRPTSAIWLVDCFGDIIHRGSTSPGWNYMEFREPDKTYHDGSSFHVQYVKDAVRDPDLVVAPLT